MRKTKLIKVQYLYCARQPLPFVYYSAKDMRCKCLLFHVTTKPTYVRSNRLEFGLDEMSMTGKQFSKFKILFYLADKD